LLLGFKPECHMPWTSTRFVLEVVPWSARYLRTFVQASKVSVVGLGPLYLGFRNWNNDVLFLGSFKELSSLPTPFPPVFSISFSSHPMSPH
jgi:hypothetical protein